MSIIKKAMGFCAAIVTASVAVAHPGHSVSGWHWSDVLSHEIIWLGGAVMALAVGVTVWRKLAK